MFGTCAFIFNIALNNGTHIVPSIVQCAQSGTLRLTNRCTLIYLYIHIVCNSSAYRANESSIGLREKGQIPSEKKSWGKYEDPNC